MSLGLSIWEDQPLLTILEKAASTGETQPPMYQAVVISDMAEFDALQLQWDAFMRQANAQNLCLTHSWLKNWLKYFPPEQLHIVIIQDRAGNWMGVAPLKISKSPTGLSHRLLRHVQFIGTQPTVFDWMQMVVSPQANETGVLGAIADSLKQVEWDVLDLQFCLERAQLETLCHFLGQDASKAIGQMDAIPYVALPATEAEYEKNRRKKTRLEVNRHRNRFAKDFDAPLHMEFLPSSDKANAMLKDFYAGHVQYWAQRGCKSDFQRFPDLGRFYQDVLADSRDIVDETTPKLLFSVLHVGNLRLSYHLGFWQGDRYLSHLTNFNRNYSGYSPGTIHMDALVFETVKLEGVEFELGRGDEPYKKMWAQDKKPLWQLRIFRTPMAQAVWAVDPLLKKLKQSLKLNRPKTKGAQ